MTLALHTCRSLQSSSRSQIKRVSMPAGDLQLGGPTPIGAQKANLSPEAEQYLQEVALNEQVGPKIHNLVRSKVGLAFAARSDVPLCIRTGKGLQFASRGFREQQGHSHMLWQCAADPLEPARRATRCSRARPAARTRARWSTSPPSTSEAILCQLLVSADSLLSVWYHASKTY